MSPTSFALEPPFDQPIFALALRGAFLRTSPRSLSLPSALSPATSAALRDLARGRWTLFDLADRGRYRFIDLRDSSGGDSQLPAASTELRAACAQLVGQLRAFSERVSGRVLLEGPARMVALSRGDYSLRLDDARTRPTQTSLEATLDLSRATGNEAAIIYSDSPWDHLAQGQLPGQLSLVERGPTSTRCDRYRSRLTGARAFVLLRCTFPLAES